MKYFITYFDSEGWEVTDTYTDRHKANDFIAIHWVDITKIVIGTDVVLSESEPTYL